MAIFDISPHPALTRLCDWFKADVLPCWLAHAWDPQSGHFHEGLALDGSALTDAKLRTRTAARMIHVYADASRLGVAPEGGLDAAIAAGEALERDCLDPNGGYMRTIDRVSGTVLDPVIDLYDQACVLLALASLFGATGQVRYRDRAKSVLRALDTRLAAPAGGWAEDDRGSLPRRQNPHMHMFEALISWTAQHPDPEFRARLEALDALLRQRLLEPSGLLREFFGPEWQLGPQWRSERCDPGHMAEWAWLQFAAGRVLGTDNTALSRSLLADALRLGTAPDGSGFLVDEVDPEGRPLTEGRRLWPQAELIKARLATGDPDGAASTADALFGSYLADTPTGTWRDRFDFEGRVLATTIPASSCYHLWTAVAPMLGEEAGR